MIVIDAKGSGTVGIVTVKDALPVTTEPSGFVAMAVMAVVPELSAVARPFALIVAIFTLVEAHVAVFVRSTVVPDPVVPMAMY